MSIDSDASNSPPITSVEELVASFRRAERTEAEHKVGLEHEKLPFDSEGRPVAYEGEAGIGALLERLAEQGYQPLRDREGGPVIGLRKGQLTVSLEPGGQVELAGTPFRTAQEAHQENLRHLQELHPLARALGQNLVALGHRPNGSPSEMPWMPKARYRAMRETLGSKGGLAKNMMLMTATGQVSLDWASEADCAEKVTVSARVTPLLVALYANSPLVEGRPSGYLSFRSHVWSDVDNSRCGYFPALLDGTFSYRAYVDWALSVPLLFLRRNGQYLTPPLTFAQLLRDGFEGEPARASDWVDHLSTLFPEVRIKQILEIRGADCNGAEMTGALPALFRGLLYDRTARQEALSLLPRLSFEEHLEFHRAAQMKGLQGELRGVPLWRLSRELVDIARSGLRRLSGDDAPLLEVLAERCTDGHSPAEAVLRTFQQQGMGGVLKAASLFPG